MKDALTIKYWLTLGVPTESQKFESSLKKTPSNEATRLFYPLLLFCSITVSEVGEKKGCELHKLHSGLMMSPCIKKFNMCLEKNNRTMFYPLQNKQPGH